MIAFFIILAAAIVLFVVIRRKKASVSAPRDTTSNAVTPNTVTPSGVMVFSSVLVSGAILAAIDEGISKTIERMPAEWIGGRNLREYKVRFVAPEGTGSQGNPYLVRGGIQTWGYVEGISTDPTGNSDRMVIVIPYQQDWSHPEWVSGTAWSESEHVVERLASIQLNDPEIFWKWARLGADDTHPHRP
jgi:hypothetical protein